MTLLSILKEIIDYIAIIIMVWGVAVSLVRLVRGEILIKDESQQILHRENIRAYLATYILLGLEIFIVADIIAIIINPTTDELIVLVIIVVVRTVISFFLEREFRSTLSDLLEMKNK